MERNPEIPSSKRDEALLYYTTPSGVPRGPSQLHMEEDFFRDMFELRLKDKEEFVN